MQVESEMLKVMSVSVLFKP